MGSSRPIWRLPKSAATIIADEDDVFDLVDALVAVRLDADFLLVAALAQEPADEVMQDAVGANPVAEDAAEEERRDQEDEAPEQPLVNGVRGDGRGEGDQRVQLEEQRDRDNP